jgi:hypothetical protein
MSRRLSPPDRDFRDLSVVGALKDDQHQLAKDDHLWSGSSRQTRADGTKVKLADADRLTSGPTHPSWGEYWGKENELASGF